MIFFIMILANFLLKLIKLMGSIMLHMKVFNDVMTEKNILYRNQSQHLKTISYLYYQTVFAAPFSKQL